MLDIDIAKCVSAILLTIFRFSLSRMPIKIHDIVYGKDKDVSDESAVRKKLERFEFHRTIIRSFGSGVYLCVCLVHLMPEVVETLCLVYDKSEANGFISALAQFYICIGFFIIYFIEEFCHWILSKVPSIPVDSKISRSGTDRFQKFVDKIQGNNRNSEETATCRSSDEIVISFVDIPERKSEISLSERIVDMMNNTNNNREEKKTWKNQKSSFMDRKSNVSQRQVVSFLFTGTGIVLHAIFEGIAIGLQHKESSKVWFLTIAMCMHSATSLFCVGMKFLALRASKQSIYQHFMFQALASPVGILLGYSILDGGKLQETLIDGYFEALSTGSILYITFFESLTREKQMRVLRIWRSVSMISGFAVMCALEYFIFLEKSAWSRQYFGWIIAGNQNGTENH